MQKITPFLWFDNQAEEAMHFYMSIFPNSEVRNVTKGPDGKVMSVGFRLEEQEFLALNAGPIFKFNEAVSFFINCKDQAEVDVLWEKLGEEGSEGQCGWIKDKYGLWWQVIPSSLPDYLGNPNPEKAAQALQAMLKMKKINVAELEEAVK